MTDFNMYSKHSLLFLIFIFLGSFPQGVLSETERVDHWRWQQDCRFSAMTNCEVWFNTIDTVKKINTFHNGQLLKTRYKSYTELKSPSDNLMLLQSNNLNHEQLQQLKKGLTLWVLKSKQYQKIGLYQSALALSMKAVLGARHADIRKVINSLESKPATEQPERHLIDVIKIIGGAREARKTVYWISTGAVLDDNTINEINLLLKTEQVRLVVVALQVTQLAGNSHISLQKLVQKTGGFFVSLRLNKWSPGFEVLANYANNGGKITINSETLCAAATLNFKAISEQDKPVLENKVFAHFPACNTQTETNATVQDPPASEDPSANQESSADQEPSIGETLTSENNKNYQKIAIATGIGLIFIIILIIFLVKKRNKNSIESMRQADVFCYLEDLNPANNQCYSLYKSTTKIGRRSNSDVVINDDAVSSDHAVIKRERDSRILIIDLKSTNGTRVNKENIQQCELYPGDTIQIGDTSLRFKLRID